MSNEHEELMVCEEDGYAPYLSSHGTRPAKPEEITIETVAAMLDQNEENENNHDLVGSYTGLAHLLRDCGVGESNILEVLRSLVDAGGLTGLTE